MPSFRDAFFNSAQLQEANFRGAQLQGAYFGFADLQRADFAYAQLQNAGFVCAQLQGAFFVEADLKGALFSGAGTNDVDAIGLTWDQFAGARNVDAAVLPDYLTEARESQLDVGAASDRTGSPQVGPP